MLLLTLHKKDVPPTLFLLNTSSKHHPFSGNPLCRPFMLLVIVHCLVLLLQNTYFCKYPIGLCWRLEQIWNWLRDLSLLLPVHLLSILNIRMDRWITHRQFPIHPCHFVSGLDSLLLKHAHYFLLFLLKWLTLPFGSTKPHYANGRLAPRDHSAGC